MNETKNKSKTFYISLLPLVIIIGLVLGTGYLLLADDIKLPKFNKGPQIRRLEGFPTIVYTEAPNEKTRLVMKSEQELDEFLNRVDPTGILTLKEKIDFNKEYLVAITSETEQEEGHEIKVRKVYEDKENKSLLVSIQEDYPGETCETTISSHIAIDIVALNKTDQTIDFERIKKIEECN